MQRINTMMRALTLGAAALLVATTVQAQGRGNGRGHDKQKVREANGTVAVPPGTIIVPGPDRGNGRRIPPGLAKKPGQMPPGQYKKLYPQQGASVLQDILVGHGYTVTRVVPSGASRSVYYRAPDGTVRRVYITSGTDRLHFQNLSSSLLNEVLSRLY